MSEQIAKGNSRDVVEGLFPKILANHISKIPDFDAIKYGTVLDTLQGDTIPIQDKIARLATLAGRTELVDTIKGEADILKLCAYGQEAEVTDTARRAAYARSDQNQISDRVSSRTLDHYLTEGIEINVREEDRSEMRRYCELDDRDVPLIEKVKSRRLVSINGFNDSRVMYATHDLIDHVWLFEKIRDAGIMQRYDDFLGSIDLSESTFLYSRQAELLASVGFGSRRWQSKDIQREELSLTGEDVTSVLAELDDKRTFEAYQLFTQMSLEKRRQAVYIIENMAIQFADERRRWGAVKQIDTAGNRSPMALLDPLHISMMIEMINLVQTSGDYKNIQLSATLAVEEVLETIVYEKGDVSSLYIPVPKEAGDTIRSRGSDTKRMEWLQRNIGLTTLYGRVD